MDYLKTGTYLQALRKTKGLTQAELAEYFEVSNKTISKWECGESLPEIPLLKALADYYGVTVDEILNGESKTRKEVTEEVHQKNQNYFVFKKIKKIKILNAIALSILFFGFMLVYIIGYTTTRADIACFVSIAFYFVSLLVIIFGILLLKDYDTLEETAQSEIEKERKKWLKIFFFSFGGCSFLSVLYYLLPQIIARMNHWYFIGVVNFGLFLLLMLIVLGLLLGIYLYTENNKLLIKFFSFLWRYHIILWLIIFSFIMCYFFCEFVSYRLDNDTINIYFYNAFMHLGYLYWIGVFLLVAGIILGIIMTIKNKTMLWCDMGFILSLILMIVSMLTYENIDVDYYQIQIGNMMSAIVIILFIMAIPLILHIIFSIIQRNKS